MTRILVTDDDPTCRERVANTLERHGYEVATAEDGQDALRALQSSPFDLLLLDLNVTHLDGLAVLRSVRRNPRLKNLPIIVHTENAGRYAVVEAARAGVSSYILKSDQSIAMLQSRIDACLPHDEPGSAGVANLDRSGAGESGQVESDAAAGSAPSASAAARLVDYRNEVRVAQDLSPVVTKDEIQSLFNKTLNLAPFGPTAKQIMSVTANAQCTVDDIAQVVSCDQALSIRLLKLANSSAYARGRPVKSVRDAVQMIGVSNIRSLVMSLSVVEQFGEVDEELFDIKLFWEHGIACGVAATQIAAARNAAGREDYFVWGLLHDVGRVILLEHLADKYCEVVKAAQVRHLPLEVVEPKLLLVDHTEILRRALELWEFAPSFIGPVVGHHLTPLKLSRQGGIEAEATATVALANRLVSALCIGSSGNNVIYPLHDLMKMLDVDAARLKDVAGQVLDETNNLRSVMLMHAHGDHWPDYAARCKEALTPLMSALALSDVALNPFELWMGRLGILDVGEQPNVAVLYCEDAQGLPGMLDKLAALETERELQRLPAIAVSDKGEPSGMDAVSKDRSLALLKTPVPHDLLIQAMNNTAPRAE